MDIKINMEKDKKEQYSREVEEILIRRPTFLVRNGILFLVILFALLLVISSFIRYPERLAASISFTSSSLAEDISLSGKIILTADAASLVKRGQQVSLRLHRNGEEGFQGVFEGAVDSILPIGTGDFFTVYVRPSSADTLSGYEGKAYILLGKSSLLSRILNPVLAVFRPANRQK